MKKLGEIFKVDNTKQLVKLKNDKLTLKRHLKVTRHNNGVLKNMIDELQTKNEEIEGQLQESKAQIANGTSKMAFLNKKIEELNTKNENSDTKVEELEGKVKELVTNHAKLASELENCKSTDADLVISQQELKECNEESDAEIKKNLQCESDKKACTEKLLNEVQKHEILLTRNHETVKSLEESRSSSAANQKLAQDCQDMLEDEIEGKGMLQKKYESVCPSWSEWSGCSETCWGTKTRTDRCSTSDEQMKSCNQFSSCPRSGK